MKSKVRDAAAFIAALAMGAAVMFAYESDAASTATSSIANVQCFSDGSMHVTFTPK